MILFLLYHKDVWIDIWKWNYLDVTILLNILKKVILASGKHRTILNKYPKIRKGVISFSPREKTRRNFFCPRSFLRIFLLTEIVVSYSLNEKIWISNVFSSQVLLIITFQYYRDYLLSSIIAKCIWSADKDLPFSRNSLLKDNHKINSIC